MVMDGYGRFVSICLLRVGLYCSEDLGNCMYMTLRPGVKDSSSGSDLSISV